MKILSLICLLFASSFSYGAEFEEIARCTASQLDGNTEFYMGISLDENEENVIINAVFVAETDEEESEVKPQDKFVTIANVGTASVSDDGIITIIMNDTDEDEIISFDLNAESFQIGTSDDEIEMDCITI